MCVWLCPASANYHKAFAINAKYNTQKKEKRSTKRLLEKRVVSCIFTLVAMCCCYGVLASAASIATFTMATSRSVSRCKPVICCCCCLCFVVILCCCLLHIFVVGQIGAKSLPAAKCVPKSAASTLHATLVHLCALHLWRSLSLSLSLSFPLHDTLMHIPFIHGTGPSPTTLRLRACVCVFV